MDDKMYKKIYNTIKKYNNIVIARHINVDPDAMASQIALRDSIRLTFSDKNVFAIGAGTTRFNHIGKLDSKDHIKDLDNILFIVVDTPDKKRVDDCLEKCDYSIKIDHHPHVETFCDIELIDDKKSSASEMVLDLIRNTKLQMNEKIAKSLFCGIVADTNRFLFNNSTSDTFISVGEMLKEYPFDITECYSNLYKRQFSEIELLGYIATNMKITENGVGYIKIANETLQKYKLDSSSAGSLINEFNNVDELLVWTIAIEDVKTSLIKVSIRSRGPVINNIAEKYNGGGHKLASGARIPSFEEYDLLVKDLDKVCSSYIERSDEDENN